jgi:hypothetical protein
VSKYYFKEKDFVPDLHKFSTDASQILEDKIRQYESGGRALKNSQVLFAFKESLRLVRQLEAEYLKAEQLKAQKDI